MYICGVVCLGIIVFSIFSPSEPQTAAAAAPAAATGGIVSIIFLFGTAVILEGFRPDFVAQIKHDHHPSSLFLYFSVNAVTFFLVLFASIVTWNIKYFFDFALNHERMLIDLAAYCFLYAMGGIFGYKLVNTFRQHIYPLVSNTRKCLTVCINVAWYGHHLAKMQWAGICLVFSGIMIEIINNYNLASKILPNDNIRSREGQHYNKLSPPQEEDLNTRYEDHLSEGVEGI